ncbi:uncharacterized protein LOC143055388 [Mytilus galloprovincialis]|uniref:uncharacterized protein LOC143055388 n=1 Tax=Mytilus galloprovincialis TaxID=29158 RepID=UPI003F7B8E66
MDTYVMISYKNIGPKMCVKECMSHNGCNSVNFRTETLVCESLTVSYPGDQLSNVSGYSFTEINRWTQDKSACWPNPCGGRTRCVTAAYNNQPICLRYDDPCHNVTCDNDGVCRNDNGGYRCNCEDGFYGPHCEYTPCSTNPCNNGGSCTYTGSSFSCNCINGYYGSKCQNYRSSCFWCKKKKK